MTLVRIIKSWQSPDLLRQSPGGGGRWENITFTLEPHPRPDYLVVLNHIPQETTLTIAPSRIWLFIQEPPDPMYRWMEKGFPWFSRIHLQDTIDRSPRFIRTHGSLPWHVNRSYDELIANSAPPAKNRDLSWITSNLALTEGHRRRLAFLDRIRATGIPFDLYGRGFQFIGDKWDALAPYRYSLAVENTVAPHYWTEKIADCFLTNTMPIYHGDPNIEEYFPKNSLVRIEITATDAPRRLLEIIRSDHAERHRDAVAEARRRILEEHNFFPRLARLITKDLLTPASTPRTITLPPNPDLTHYYHAHTPFGRALRSLKRRLLPS